VNNLPKVVTQRCPEQDLNLRPTDRKPKCLTVTPPRQVTVCKRKTSFFHETRHSTSLGGANKPRPSGTVGLSKKGAKQGSVATRLERSWIFI